jgi:regulator of nucleoside diphosphate kinase
MVQQLNIYITEQDRERLENLISLVRTSSERSNISYVKTLAEGLDYAEVVAPEKIPQDVITMRSKVKLKDLDTQEESVYSVVFPSEADLDKRKISILAPMATALLGHSVGDTVAVQAPGGLRRLKVAAVLYQPESAGDYDL